MQKVINVKATVIEEEGTLKQTFADKVKVKVQSAKAVASKVKATAKDAITTAKETYNRLTPEQKKAMLKEVAIVAAETGFYMMAKNPKQRYAARAVVFAGRGIREQFRGNYRSAAIYSILSLRNSRISLRMK